VTGTETIWCTIAHNTAICSGIFHRRVHTEARRIWKQQSYLESLFY